MPARDERGFTLVELLVTVALMGILTTIAIPVYMQQLPSIRLKAAARRMASVISLSRMAAVSTNQQCRIVFRPGSGDYYSYLDLDKDAAADAPSEMAATRLDLGPITGPPTGLLGIALPTAVSFGAAPGVTGVPPATGGPVPSDGVDLPSDTLILDPRGTTNAMNNVETIYLRNTKGETMAIRVTYAGLTQVYAWRGGAWQ